MQNTNAGVGVKSWDSRFLSERNTYTLAKSQAHVLCPCVALSAHRINAGRAGQLLRARSGDEVMGKAGGEMEQRRTSPSAQEGCSFKCCVRHLRPPDRRGGGIHALIFSTHSVLEARLRSLTA